MPTNLSVVDWRYWFEAVHAASVVVLPVIGFFAWVFKDKVRAFLRTEVTEAMKHELKGDLHATVISVFQDRTPVFKQICKEANDTLLTQINGTYVRTREQVIKDKNVEDRLNRIEDKVDTLISR